MRTRQAQALIADVYALLDEVTGLTSAGYSTGVKPAPADVLESLNQGWCDVYGMLIQAGIGWNMRTSIFSTANGQDLYGFGVAANSSSPGTTVANASSPWTAGVASLAVSGPGIGLTNGTYPLTFAGGAPAPGAIAATGTALVAGGVLSTVTLTRSGSGYTSAPTVTVAAGGAGASIAPTMAGDYWKTGGVDVELSGTQWFPAHRFQFEQRNDYQLSDWSWPRRILYDAWGGTSDASGADGTLLKFLPSPPGGYQVRHFWYPAPQRLVAMTDVFDGVAGAERAIVYGAAQELAYMLEQLEIGDKWGMLKEQKVARCVSMMRDRNVGESPMARVVRGRGGRGMRNAWWRG